MMMSIKNKIQSIESKNLKDVRKRLLHIEGKATETYYHQIFQLLPKKLKIEKRKSWKAYDGINNAFNLAYTLLRFRVHSAILKAHLEPYLGFVHTETHSKPSLVCDFMELYRSLIDNFVIQFSQTLTPKDFILKPEWFFVQKLGKRQVLNKEKTKQLTQKLNEYFETKIEIPRIRHGNKQTLETLINEEALLLAKYLRNKIPTWKPRIAIPN